MFVVMLELSDNKAKASEFMAAHNEWLKQGFIAGIFLLASGIEFQKEGAVIAHNISLEELQQKVDSDPYVIEHVVTAEIYEIP